MTYEEAAEANTAEMEKILLKTSSAVLMREDKVNLTPSYCPDVEGSLELKTDLDGLVIILDKFASIRMPVTFINFQKPVCYARPVVGKTRCKHLTWQILLSQSLETQLTLLANHKDPLQQFYGRFKRVFERMDARDKQRPSILRNSINSKFLKVYHHNDQEFFLGLLDMALDNVRRSYHEVSNGSSSSPIMWYLL